MQLFCKIGSLNFGNGELTAVHKRKMGRKVTTWTETYEIGELYYEDEVHLVRIQSLAEVVPLAEYVDADLGDSIQESLMEFASIVAFFAVGTNARAVNDAQLPLFRDQLGFGTTALRDIFCLEPVITNGEHICYLHQIGIGNRDEHLIRVTTQLTDMSMSKVVLCKWQGMGRM